MATSGTRTRRWTRVEYEKLIDRGILQPGEPVELIGGELMVAEPQDAFHYTAIRKTVRALPAAHGNLSGCRQSRCGYCGSQW